MLVSQSFIYALVLIIIRINTEHPHIFGQMQLPYSKLALDTAVMLRRPKDQWDAWAKSGKSFESGVLKKLLKSKGKFIFLIFGKLSWKDLLLVKTPTKNEICMDIFNFYWLLSSVACSIFFFISWGFLSKKRKLQSNLFTELIDDGKWIINSILWQSLWLWLHFKYWRKEN